MAVSTVPSVPSNTLDKNAFLKLFTVQLRNQDPLNPMDATAFTAQMAQFSSLEQLYNVNTNLNNLISSQNNLLQGISVNLLGKRVTLPDGSTGQVTAISFDGTKTSVVIDNQKTILLTNVQKISI
jgi:flagellar basal-body rod modification protein FlgD